MKRKDFIPLIMWFCSVMGIIALAFIRPSRAISMYILRDAERVEPEKRGYFVHYRINHHMLAKWKKAMEQFLEKDVSDNAYKIPEKGEGTCVMKSSVAKNRKS